jgi:hypothetical protein
MSANKYIPHVLVLPEDDANIHLANGFLLHEALDVRAIQVLDCAGGWREVRGIFDSDHIDAMRRYPKRHMVLLVDFDEDSNRFNKMTDGIPEDLAERVFVIGVWTEPEDLRRANIGSKEEVGLKLARECYDESRDVWDHRLFRHNARELGRMITVLRPILFSTTV